jgi:uncharacterized membrane protein YdjX (TVP38/TMEM64 family)
MIRNPFDNPESRQRIIGYVMVGAILAAPFLGLLYAVWIGALVMALALMATSFVAFDMVTTLPEERRPRIRRLAQINLFLAVACLIAAMVSFF